MKENIKTLVDLACTHEEMEDKLAYLKHIRDKGPTLVKIMGDGVDVLLNSAIYGDIEYEITRMAIDMLQQKIEASNVLLTRVNAYMGNVLVEYTEPEPLYDDEAPKSKLHLKDTTEPKCKRCGEPLDGSNTSCDSMARGYCHDCVHIIDMGGE